MSGKHCASGTVRPDRRHDHSIRRIDHRWHRFRRAERRLCHCHGNDPGPKPVSPPALLVATACEGHAKPGAGRSCSTGAPAVGVASAEQFRPPTAVTLPRIERARAKWRDAPGRGAGVFVYGVLVMVLGAGAPSGSALHTQCSRRGLGRRAYTIGWRPSVSPSDAAPGLERTRAGLPIQRAGCGSRWGETAYVHLA